MAPGTPGPPDRGRRRGSGQPLGAGCTWVCRSRRTCPEPPAGGRSCSRTATLRSEPRSFLPHGDELVRSRVPSSWGACVSGLPDLPSSQENRLLPWTPHLASLEKPLGPHSPLGVDLRHKQPRKAWGPPCAQLWATPPCAGPGAPPWDAVEKKTVPETSHMQLLVTGLL